VEEGDVVVCHSNGAAIAHRAASEFFAKIGQLVLINPALDADVSFPHQIAAVHVWHSPSDLPVRFAKWIPFARWGDMGAVGYRGAYDARVKNYDKEFGYEVRSKSHSDIFTGPRLKFFAPLIVAEVSRHL
jgi:alpha-beta hydrolase superfamily lysophospholipase